MDYVDTIKIKKCYGFDWCSLSATYIDIIFCKKYERPVGKVFFFAFLEKILIRIRRTPEEIVAFFIKITCLFIWGKKIKEEKRKGKSKSGAMHEAHNYEAHLEYSQVNSYMIEKV